ncbi:MAG TPA: ELWxxDGT repeat protein [Thermoanaerobaculia bacterium]|nr:ELWxxDGT repeat protein [Thermoanaerobaculia bacterium]
MIHARSLFLLALLLAPAAGTAQPAFQVADLNTTQPRAVGIGQMIFLTAVGPRLFFLGDDGLHGAELWWVDGTTGATAMVKDICPGGCPSSAAGVTLSNGILYFWASDGVHGYELWRSDGTEAGTFMLHDLYPGGWGSGIISGTPLLDVGGTLFFGADDGVHGGELWKVNATGTGVELVADIRPGAAGSNPHPWLSKDGELIFSANDGDHGRELWRSDGTEAGTDLIRDLNPGAPSSVPDPYNLFEYHYALPDGTFLLGADDGVHGNELWRSDGTEAGTVLVKDISSGADGSSPFSFAPLNGKVVFAASTPDLGREIWSTDGTGAGTVLFADATPGAASSSLGDLTAVGSQLFFLSGFDASNTGRALYRTDGTAPGKVLIDSDVREIHPLGNSLLYLAGGVGSFQSLELWKTEGNPAGNVLLADFGFQLENCFRSIDPAAVGGAVYFHTCPSNMGQSLWKSNGTPGGTAPVHQPTRTSSLHQYIQPLGLLSGNLIFPASDGGPTLELFRTDGTPGGTAPLSGNAPTVPWLSGFSSAGRLGNALLFHSPYGTLWKTDGTGAGTEAIVPNGVGSLEVLGSIAVFSRFAADSGRELWKTDGTAAGTALLKNILPGTDSSDPILLGKLGPWVLFSAQGTPGSPNRELWRTDGSEAGTVLVSSSPLNPANLVALEGGTALFTAGASIYDGELWKTDGTTAGTSFVEDVITGVPFYFPVWHMTAARNRAFFTLDDGVYGLEVWVSDGTAAGTHVVKDIVPGLGTSEPWDLVTVRNRAFFVATDATHGRELWTSDGTEAGTRVVKDIVPGPDSLRISSLASMGHALVFAATDDEHGYEPWVSNGTEAGTRRLEDIAPGPLPSSPGGFFRAFPNAYFVANDGTAGFELWSVPRTALGGSFGDVPTSHWAWRQIETLAENGITNGCSTGADYCPASFLTRAEMAIFLGRALHGASFVPPAATGTRFQDVPANFWAASWIEQIATDGVTQGCSASPPLFCPGSSVTRAEMAIFLLRALHGGSYTPPPATGTVFTDVPANHWAGAWIERLAAEGITSGCAPGLYCPGGLVNRAEMAVFLTRAFGLGEL